MPTITIQVIGAPGTGKSCVVQSINKLLTDAGFAVTLEGAIAMRDEDLLAKAIASVAKTTPIIVRELHPPHMSGPVTGIAGIDQ